MLSIIFIMFRIMILAIVAMPFIARAIKMYLAHKDCVSLSEYIADFFNRCYQ